MSQKRKPPESPLIAPVRHDPHWPFHLYHHEGKLYRNQAPRKKIKKQLDDVEAAPF